MNQLAITFLVLILGAALVVFAESIIDAWYDKADQRNYRRLTHPKNIEQTSQDLLELELQEFLREEELKERAKNRRAHPSGYMKPTLDGGTREILSNLADPKVSRRNNQNWWGD